MKYATSFICYLALFSTLVLLNPANYYDTF